MTKKHDPTFKMTLPPTVRARQTLLLTWTFLTKNGDKSTQKILWHLGILARTAVAYIPVPNYSVCEILQNHSRKKI